ncbi:MAG: ester cyclase [Anaerolineae bacterium]|nr:ester cyclase [Anaerolineae bacterium]NUQ07206.1 ester cyclase [Anaerolineae bacterium]
MVSIEQQNKEFARWYIDEVFNKHDLSKLLTCFAEDVYGHSLPPEVPNGIQGVTIWFTALFTGLPDIHANVYDIIAEGDTVLSRGLLTATHTGQFLVLPPTYKKVAVPVIEVWRVKDRKLVDYWGGIDSFGMMQQMGVVPPMGG